MPKSNLSPQFLLSHGFMPGHSRPLATRFCCGTLWWSKLVTCFGLAAKLHPGSLLRAILKSIKPSSLLHANEHYWLCSSVNFIHACLSVCRFMAPEVLSSNVLPASDIWAAGILAYQLLSGQLPFDDPKASLPKIWKAILTQEPSFGGSSWNEISPEAKSFVQALLHK